MHGQNKTTPTHFKKLKLFLAQSMMNILRPKIMCKKETQVEVLAKKDGNLSKKC